MASFSTLFSLVFFVYVFWIFKFDDYSYNLEVYALIVIFIIVVSYIVAYILNIRIFGEYLFSSKDAKKIALYKYIVPKLPNDKVAPVPNYHMIEAYQYKPEMLDDLALPFKAQIEESRMAKKVVAFLHSYKHVPATLDGGHGGATLWQHSWNVVRVGMAVAHAYYFTPLTLKANLAVLRNMAKAYKGLPHEHRGCIDANDPFVLLLLLAHDIGKAHCYAQVAGKWEKVKDRHGPVGAAILHALGAPVLLPLHEANALNMIVTYYHVRHFAPSSEFFTEKDYQLLDFLYHVDVLTSAIEEGTLDSLLEHDASLTADQKCVAANTEKAPDLLLPPKPKQEAPVPVLSSNEPEKETVVQKLTVDQNVVTKEPDHAREEKRIDDNSHAVATAPQHVENTSSVEHANTSNTEVEHSRAHEQPAAEQEKLPAHFVDLSEDRIKLVSSAIAKYKKLRNETRRAALLLLNKKENGVMYLDYAWLSPRALIETLLASIPLKEMQADFELSESDFEGDLPIFFRALVYSADKEGAVYYGNNDQLFTAQDAVFLLETETCSLQTIGIHPVFFGLYKVPAGVHVKKFAPVSTVYVSRRDAQNLRAKMLMFRQKAEMVIAEHKTKSNKKPDVSTVKTKSTFDLVKFLATLGNDVPKEIVLKEDVVLIQREFFETNYILNKSRTKYDIIKIDEIEYYQFKLP